MEKGRLAGILALAVVTAVTVGVEYPQMAAQQREAAEYRALLEATPLAQVEGETLSPDGRFEVRTTGQSEMYVSGYVVPEFLQIVDTETGEILWQEPGGALAVGAVVSGKTIWWPSPMAAGPGPR